MKGILDPGKKVYKDGHSGSTAKVNKECVGDLLGGDFMF